MSNQAYSDSNDLMLGAGVLYFMRDDDQNKSLHHLGNVEEFTLTTDVTTVEKKSSMNQRRALLASVTTETSPTASLTLDEYNPFNLALGLYGHEGIHEQEATTLSAVGMEVTSVPGILELKDKDGNRYKNVTNVVVAPAVSTPSKATFVGGVSSYTDPAGGTIAITGSYTGTTATTITVNITSAATTAGSDLLGVVFTWQEGSLGPVHTEILAGGSKTETVALGSTGVSLKFDFTGATDNFTVGGSVPPVSCTPASGSFTDGVEYTADPQDLQAGLIKINDTDKIKVGDTVLVSAEVPKDRYVTVSGANAGKIHGKLVFVGDPNQGDRYVLEGWSVDVQPNGDVAGLISDGSDFSNFQLTIKFLSDYKHHPSCEYYLLTKTGSANDNSYHGTYDPHE